MDPKTKASVHCEPSNTKSRVTYRVAEIGPGLGGPELWERFKAPDGNGYIFEVDAGC
ncbi:MAG: hypothetical protein KF869_07930 [Phycisphaeraceae bacterium]|nr:hypothetical protein [Phycisphaeraceae bacterium]